MKAGHFFCAILCLLTFITQGQTAREVQSLVQRGHAKAVTCAAYSQDGKYVVTGGKDHSIKIWNRASGLQIRELNHHTAAINSVQFSQNGYQVLSSAADQTVRLFDGESGEQQLKIEIADQTMRQAILSPGDSLIMTQTDHAKIAIWDARTGKMLAQTKQGHQGKLHAGNWSADNKWLFERPSWKQTILTNLSSSSDSIFLESDKPHNVHFSPDGKFLVVGSAKLKAEVFDANSGKLVHTLIPDEEEKCDGCNTYVTVSGDSKFTALTSRKIGVSIFSLSSGKKMWQSKPIEERVSGVQFDPSGRHVMINGGDHLWVYDAKTGALRFDKESDWLAYYVPTFSPGGNHILIPAENNVLQEISASSGKVARTFKGIQNQTRTDGLRFDPTSYWDQGILQYINLKSSVAVSPDGRFMARGNVDSSVVILDLKTGRIAEVLQGHSALVYKYAYSPDGRFLATAGGDRQILLWDMNQLDQGPVRRLKGHREVVLDLSYSQDGLYLVSSAWDGTAIVWDVADNYSGRYIDTKSSPLVARMSPKNLYLSTAGIGGKFQTHEADALELFKQYIGHTELVTDVAFSNTRTMLSASLDGSVKTWDLGSGMVVDKYRHASGSVNALALSPSMIASGGADRVIYLRDLESGKSLGQLTGHTNSITHLEFTHEGQQLVSVSSDGEIKIWDMATAQVILTYYQLSKEQWLVMGPGGQFDGTQRAQQQVNYVSGMKSMPVERFFERYYTPGLFQRLMAGERFESTGNVDAHMDNTYALLLNLASDSIHVAKDSTVQLKVTIPKQATVQEIRVFNNGKLVGQRKVAQDLVFRGDGKQQLFNVPLVNGVNDLSVVGLDNNRTELAPVAATIKYDGQSAGTDLFILAVGINDYLNSNYDLEYAVNDVKTFVKEVEKGGVSLFGSVHKYFIQDDKANKVGLLAAADQVVQQAGPEDVFIFYYAGHGVLGERDFHIVTHDITNLYGDQAMLDSKSVSASELVDISRKIKAQKQLFVLDACHSGGALTAFAQRGAGREKALAQLARSTGTFFMTASQDQQYANEAGNLKHGLFTYAILEALEGLADVSGDTKVTVGEIKSYVEDRVPELTEQYHGNPQYPTSYSFGQDFPVVLIER